MPRFYFDLSDGPPDSEGSMLPSPTAAADEAVAALLEVACSGRMTQGRPAITAKVRDGEARTIFEVSLRLDSQWHPAA